MAERAEQLQQRDRATLSAAGAGGRGRARGAGPPGPRAGVHRPHPGGVDIDLCERVSRELAPLRERYALEVSSPGIERPLVKPGALPARDGQPGGRAHGRADRRAPALHGHAAGARRRCRSSSTRTARAVRIAYSAIQRGQLVFDPAGRRPGEQGNSGGRQAGREGEGDRAGHAAGRDRGRAAGGLPQDARCPPSGARRPRPRIRRLHRLVGATPTPGRPTWRRTRTTAFAPRPRPIVEPAGRWPRASSPRGARARDRVGLVQARR